MFFFVVVVFFFLICPSGGGHGDFSSFIVCIQAVEICFCFPGRQVVMSGAVHTLTSRSFTVERGGWVRGGGQQAGLLCYGIRVSIRMCDVMSTMDTQRALGTWGTEVK